MVDAPKSILASVDLKDMLQNGCSADGLLRGNDVLVAKANENLENKKRKVDMLRMSTMGDDNKSKRSARVLLRRAHLEGRQRRKDGMERKVNTLKRLIPKSDSTGLEGLFKETANYILSLQTRVRVMQFMVDSLTCSANDDH